MFAAFFSPTSSIIHSSISHFLRSSAHSFWSCGRGRVEGRLEGNEKWRRDGGWACLRGAGKISLVGRPPKTLTACLHFSNSSITSPPTEREVGGVGVLEIEDKSWSSCNVERLSMKRLIIAFTFNPSSIIRYLS